jgi:hypothetical protein
MSTMSFSILQNLKKLLMKIARLIIKSNYKAD